MIVRKLGIWIILFGQVFHGLSQEILTNGAANHTGDQCIAVQATPNFASGTFWTEEKFDLNADLDLIFRIDFRCASDVDGLAFVMQPTGAFVGNYSGRLGLEGVSPSLAFEVDLQRNNSDNDPEFDHLAVLSNGHLDHLSVGNSIAPVRLSNNQSTIDRCALHWLRIQFDKDDEIFVVSFDCEEKIRFTITDELRQTISPFHWGCTIGMSSSTATVEICPEFIEASLDTVLIEGKCPGDTILLAARVEGWDYRWSPEIGLLNPLASTTEVILAQNNDYHVVVTDDCGLQWREDFKISTNFHQYEFGVDTILCTGEELVIDLGNQPFAGTMQWNSGELTPTKMINTSGNYYLHGIGETCLLTDTIRVQLFSELSEFLESDLIACQGSMVKLGHPQMMGYDPLWSTGEVGSFIEINSSGVYGYSIDHRCGSQRESIKVDFQDCGVYIPNAFSPNGDLINDHFKPLTSGGDGRLIMLKIYDRWGAKVFGISDLELASWMGWDGKTDGREAPAGSYFFETEIELQTGSQSFGGEIVLLR